MNPRQPSRRTFLEGLAAGTLVLGFDIARRSWVGAARADGRALAIPNLRGTLATDPVTLQAFGEDFGHLVQRTPVAVLRPAAVDDVVRAVAFCKEHGLKVAMRGQGQSGQGQALVEGGLVIDSAPLNAIEQLASGFAIVQAGVRWTELLALAEPGGQRPPVVPGFTGLSVGGTLSMGGIGPGSFRFGAIVNNVLSLDVVTGDGVLRSCSATENPKLFAAVLGGVGQYGLIVRAKLALAAVGQLARSYTIAYRDFGAFFADLTALNRAEQVDGLYALLLPGPPTPAGVSSVLCRLNAVKYWSGAPPDDGALLGALRLAPGQLKTSDTTAFGYDTFVDQQYAHLPPGPHVWSDLFVPASKAAAFVQSTMGTLTRLALGPGGVCLLYPTKNATPGAMALALPAEESVFLFDVLTSGVPGVDGYATEATEKARARFEAARALGGTLYPIGGTPMSKDDWASQQGKQRPALMAAKAAFDPAGILTPGAGIY